MNLFQSPFVLVRKALSKVAINLGSPVAFSMPFQVLIETTNRCNLRCPLCPVGDKRMTRKREDMDIETYKTAIDQISFFSPILTLCNFGETFLYPHLLEACRYAKRKGFRIEMTTNCQAFPKDEAFFVELVKAGVDYIKVALDGVDEESLTKYRKGASFARAVNGIRNLVEARKKLKSKTPRIPLQFILMKHNEDQVERIKLLGQELGVDEVLIKSLFIDVELDNAAELANTFLSKYAFNRIKIDDNGKLSEADYYSNRCPLIYETSVILVNGDVAACCHDYNGVFILGNVMQSSFKKIWNGEKYRDLRRQIRNDRSRFSICRTCTVGLKTNVYKKI